MTSPATLRAGDSATWEESTPSHLPADGWEVKARIIFVSGTPVALDGAPTVTGASFAVGAATSSAWPAGTATLILYAERGSGPTLERATLSQAAVQILPNLLTATTHDGRSVAARTLADLEAALASYAQSGKGHVQSYTIAGRSMQFRSAADILDLIRYYRAEVARERATTAILQGGSPGRIIAKL